MLCQLAWRCKFPAKKSQYWLGILPPSNMVTYIIWLAGKHCLKDGWLAVVCSVISWLGSQYGQLGELVYCLNCEYIILTDPMVCPCCMEVPPPPTHRTTLIIIISTSGCPSSRQKSSECDRKGDPYSFVWDRKAAPKL